MSGGVDSSATALLLQQQGYEVLGITLNLCNNDAPEKAKAVADQLSTEHHTIDCSNEFENKVIKYFAESYIKGETPNPCVKCNQLFKFGILLDEAKKVGAKVATGHYAVIKNNRIYKPKDETKDQTYFLAMLTGEQVENIVFPLGNYTKKEVKNIALENNLATAESKESQDICFIPGGDYKPIVKSIYPKTNSGNIISVEGEVVGRHDGIINYTVGQRRGLGVSAPNPLYVVEIRDDDIIVGEREHLFSKEVHLRDFNFISERLEEGSEIEIKCRYTQKPVKAFFKSETLIIAEEPIFGIAKGQICAVYQGEWLIGGGWIINN